MTVTLVAAVAANGVIGKGGALPWRLPDDMKRFRRLTMGHAVVMGHATWRSLGRPLDGRRNIVLSRDAALRIEGCEVVHAASDVLSLSDVEELFVIGGSAVYALFLPHADRLVITWIDVAVDGDAFFPTVDWDEWTVLSESAAISVEGGPPHRFVDYGRKMR